MQTKVSFYIGFSEKNYGGKKSGLLLVSRVERNTKLGHVQYIFYSSPCAALLHPQQWRLHDILAGKLFLLEAKVFLCLASFALTDFM